MKTVTDFVVPWVREAESYSDRHMEFAWAHPEILRLMSNENPLPPALGVVEAVDAAARLGNLYPDTGPKLRQRLGEMAGLGAANVVLGNGSTDVINFVIETFVAPGDEVVIPVPTFPMYETRTRVSGGVPVLVPMRPDFYWDVDATLAAVTGLTKLIFISTPNNPTGNEIEAADLRRILGLGVPTFVDEAYYELTTRRRTYAGWVKDYPNAIVNRTFSKAFGLAGMRLGYCYADETVASYLNRKKIPWNVNLLVLAAAMAVLDEDEDQDEKRRVTIEGRDWLCAEINQIEGLRALPSEGNFVLIDASALGRPSRQIVDDMIARGVFVRPMAGHHLDGFVRVTVGTPEQNRRFLECFRACIADVLQKG